jgi:hypothetical protein
MDITIITESHEVLAGLEGDDASFSQLAGLVHHEFNPEGAIEKKKTSVVRHN